jgi:hypothetical protein
MELSELPVVVFDQDSNVTRTAAGRFVMNFIRLDYVRQNEKNVTNYEIKTKWSPKSTNKEIEAKTKKQAALQYFALRNLLSPDINVNTKIVVAKNSTLEMYDINEGAINVTLANDRRDKYGQRYNLKENEIPCALPIWGRI